jgi:hypothetical protein
VAGRSETAMNELPAIKADFLDHACASSVSGAGG